MNRRFFLLNHCHVFSRFTSFVSDTFERKELCRTNKVGVNIIDLGSMNSSHSSLSQEF
jgi:hypothetical protein